MSNEYQVNAHLSNDDADEFKKKIHIILMKKKLMLQKILKSMLNQTF